MESTATYWKPVFYALEDDLEVWLLNAGHMKAVPGRKTDVKDAEWIAQLLEHGLLRPSGDVPVREDHQELRVELAGQAGFRAMDPGRRVRVEAAQGPAPD